MAWHDEEDDFGDDFRDEDPDPCDMTPDDCTTVRCTFCGKPIFDDADRCPYCKRWQVQEEQFRKPHWFVATVIICVATLALGGAIAWALRGVL